ncbi:MAG: hypothetical protein PHC60_04965 [Heliobacteriaceae bacterium]|nr:hypothetical protein [Heliobacteriaceae bacterium]MDD4587722.1 hypothetical protein [Heliobacteriaceae bacterium]
MMKKNEPVKPQRDNTILPEITEGLNPDDFPEAGVDENNVPLRHSPS